MPFNTLIILIVGAAGLKATLIEQINNYLRLGIDTCLPCDTFSSTGFKGSATPV